MNFRIQTRQIIAFALCALGCVGSGLATAQDYPNKPITMMMPYAPGGPGDTITRLFAGSMQKILGQQIVVDNTADVVQVDTATANDTIESSASYTLSANVNTLILEGSSNVTGAGGNESRNRLPYAIVRSRGSRTI